MNSNKLNIHEFYRNKSIFITGGTGFLGKVLIEKLLRTFLNKVDKIYLLVRRKKSTDSSERLNDLFKTNKVITNLSLTRNVFFSSSYANK